MSNKVMAGSRSRPRPEAMPAPDPGQRPGKAYSSPQLIEWGSLRELTRGGSGAAMDYDFITTKAL